MYTNSFNDLVKQSITCVNGKERQNWWYALKPFFTVWCVINMNKLTLIYQMWMPSIFSLCPQQFSPDLWYTDTHIHLHISICILCFHGNLNLSLSLSLPFRKEYMTKSIMQWWDARISWFWHRRSWKIRFRRKLGELVPQVPEHSR